MFAMNNSGELLRKVLNNLRDILGDDAEGIDYSFALDFWTSIPERYKWDELRGHAHATGGLAEFCAVFQYLARGNCKGMLEAVSPSSGERAHSSLRANNLYKPMFVRIIDLMEPPQGALPSTSSSLVWLQPLDLCLMAVLKIANHTAPVSEFHAFKAGNPLLGCSDQENRELGVACGCFGFQKRQLIHHPIEGRPKIMDNLPNPNSPTGVRWRAANMYAINVISSLRIELRPDDLIVGVLPKSVLGSAESLDFIYCTPFLEARAKERMHELHYDHDRDKISETEDSKGLRDTRSQERRVSRESEQGSQAFTPSPPEEVASRGSGPESVVL